MTGMFRMGCFVMGCLVIGMFRMGCFVMECLVMGRFVWEPYPALPKVKCFLYMST